jgi:Glucodextranase, domain B
MSPSPTRLSRHRRIERRRGLPLVARLLLGISIVALGGFVLWAGSGAVGPFIASTVRGFGSFVASIGAVISSPSPSPSGTASGAPVVEPPDQAYTNAASVAVTVHVPASVAGLHGYTCRLWVTLPNKAPAVVTEVPIGATSVLVIPNVALVTGRNDLQASVVGPGAESALSAVATWILDTSKPKITIISPKDGSSVAQDTATIKGKTQAGSTVRLQDNANSAPATVKADSTGLFSAVLAIAKGPNKITITVTDPAGNSNTATLTLTRGTGQLKVTLTGSAYRFRASKLPRTVVFTAVVTGADGHRLAGARALFTISVPGLQVIVSSPILTDANGVATFSTSIPRGAMAGGGLALVLITPTTGTATASARQVLTVQ